MGWNIDWEALVAEWRAVAEYAERALYIGPSIEFTVDVTPPPEPADLELEYQAFLRALGEKQ